MSLSDRELDQRLARLTRFTEAPAAPWPAIRKRIGRKQQRWTGRVAAAAAMAAALALAVLVTELPDRSSPAAVVISAEVEAMRSQATGYHLPVSRPINGGLDEAWAENQAAIRELEAALARHPDNTMLIEFLAQARLRQSQLINKATAGGALADSRSI